MSKNTGQTSAAGLGALGVAWAHRAGRDCTSLRASLAASRNSVSLREAGQESTFGAFPAQRHNKL